MIVTFIKPNIGSKEQKKFIPLDKMQPLSLGILASLTPPDVKIKFYDDRIEEIPYDEPTNLAAITVETFTAKRAYQIAKEYRARGVPVILGGFHPTLLPEEGMNYADSVVIGEAEDQWPSIIRDLEKGELKKLYHSPKRPSLIGLKPKRNIFKGKKYIPVNTVEFGRGCKHICKFCSITAFYKHTYKHRPVEDVIEEIKSIGNKEIIFFADDNIVAEPAKAKELFSKLILLKIKWISQASIDFTSDNELVELMAKSGCLGLVIGFESLEEKTLTLMEKKWNINKSYKAALEKIKEKGLMIWAGFLAGYDYDTHDTFKKILEFSLKHHFAFIATNHLVPYPGTPLYDRLIKGNRLVFEKWWLEEEYKYNQISFKPNFFNCRRIKKLLCVVKA